MTSLQRCASWLAAAILVGATAGALAQQRDFRSNDLLLLADMKAPIEWKESWDATVRANRDAWIPQIAQQVPANQPSARDQRLNMRLIHLLEALLEKYPDDVPHRQGAYRELGDRYAGAGLDPKGADYLRKLVEQFPGRVDLAVPALADILTRNHVIDRNGGRNDLYWIEYAATRLLALNRAGLLPDQHPAVAQAWEATAFLRGRQFRLAEAQEALDQFRRLTGKENVYHSKYADLLLTAGHMVLASRYLSDQGDSRHAEVLDSISERIPPDFPRRLDLEMKWDAIRNLPLVGQERDVLTLLKEDGQGNSLVPVDAGRQVTLWVAVDNALRQQGPGDLAALRQEMQFQVRGLLDEARRADDPAALMALFRRLPWADIALEGMVEYGELALRAGQPGLATKAFGDVLTRAEDADLRKQAQVGLWVALAQEPANRAALEASLAQADANEKYPLLGDRMTVAAIRQKLLPAVAGVSAPASVPTGDVVHMVHPPAVFPWASEMLDTLAHGIRRALPPDLWAMTAGEGHVYLGGPNALACLDAQGKTLQWVRQYRQTLSDGPMPRQVSVCPGGWGMTLAGGRVYMRWGLNGINQFPAAAAAFDAQSGQVLWSTEGDPAWQGLRPACDPVPAEGRVYLLAIGHGLQTPVYLMCLDANTGKALWKRLIASPRVGVAVSAGGDAGTVELGGYGNPVTVRDGTVYCSISAGVVAACDARDGMLEWAATYAGSRSPLWATARRRGAAPVVAGNLVVVMPRDYQGMMAFNRQTGQLAWENPFVPCGQVIGQTDGAIFVRDHAQVGRVDPATGQLIWCRQLEGIKSQAALAGSAVAVPTEQGIVWLDAASGKTVSVKPWPESGGGLAWSADQGLMALADAHQDGAEKKPLNPQAAAECPAGTGPVALAWGLARQNARLTVPPARVGLAGRVLVQSQRMLECVQATPRGQIDWQMVLPIDFVEVGFADKTLLVLSQDQVAAVEPATGKVRWKCDPDFPIGINVQCGTAVLLSTPAGQNPLQMVLLDLSTGKRLWARQISELGTTYLRDIVYDGKAAHLLMSSSDDAPQSLFLTIRVEDGVCSDMRYAAPTARQMHGYIGSSGEWGLVGPGGYSNVPRLIQFSALGTGKVEQMPFVFVGQYTDVRMSPPWLIVDSHGPNVAVARAVQRIGDAQYNLSRPVRGYVLSGDRLYEYAERTVHAERTVYVVDLPGKREIGKYVLPPEAAGQVRTPEMWEDGNQVVVAQRLRGAQRTGRFRLDVFDRDSARLVHSQTLPETFTYRPDPENNGQTLTQVVRVGNVILLTDMNGVYAYVPQAAAGVSPQSAMAYRLGQPAKADGALAKWNAADGPAIAAKQGPPGKLLLGHDESNLLITARVPDASFRSRAGRSAGGDQMQVYLLTAEGPFGAAVSGDSGGRAAIEPVSGLTLPQGVAGSVGVDPGSGDVVYELSIPIDSLMQRRGRGNGWRQMELGVLVNDDSSDPAGLRQLAYGKALEGVQGNPFGLESIYLHDMTRGQETAGLAMVDASPDLAASWAVLQNMVRARQLVGDPRAHQLCIDFLKRHPGSCWAVGVMSMLDGLLRSRYGDKTPEEVVKLAVAAQVPAVTQKAYQSVSSSYLSQWVFIEPDTPIDGLSIALMDDLGAPGLACDLAEVPYAQWFQVRIPLTQLGMQDRPIGGVMLTHNGRGVVYWDRTAIFVGGKETVLVDDRVPGARFEGGWNWSDKQVKSGAKSLSRPQGRGQPTAVIGFAPFVGHWSLAESGATLSQWVYLDPVKPATALAVSLHTEAGWLRFAWGPEQRGLTMGGVPSAGVWQQLRIPLTYPQLAGRTIDGIMFESAGGPTVWDATSVIVGGQEKVILDDQPLVGASEPADWEWVTTPVKSGKRAHAQTGDGGHAVSSLRSPIIAHMAVDPAVAIKAFGENLPGLKGSLTGYEFFHALSGLVGSGPQRRDLYVLYLRLNPGEAQRADFQTELFGFVGATEKDGARAFAAVEGILRDAGLDSALPGLRQRYLHAPVAQWNISATQPKPTTAAAGEFRYPFGPGVDLQRGVWKRPSPSPEWIDLAASVGLAEGQSAYAVTWVYADKAQPADLELACVDPVRVWVGGKLVLERQTNAEGVPRGDVVALNLPAGWSEVLLQITATRRNAAFQVEFRDATTGLHAPLKAFAAPPGSGPPTSASAPAAPSNP